jgi:hypothetical protein
MFRKFWAGETLSYLPKYEKMKRGKLLHIIFQISSAVMFSFYGKAQRRCNSTLEIIKRCGDVTMLA